MSIKSGKEIADFIRSMITDDSPGHYRVSKELLEEWANAIDPQGFIVTGLNTEQLARNIANHGKAYDLLQNLLEVFGMTLTCSDDVRYHMEAAIAPEFTVGAHIGKTLYQAIYPRGKWLDYHMLFRMQQGGAVEIATQGLTERTDEEVRERWVESYWERSPEGEAVFHRKANAEAPEWVREANELINGRA